MHPPSQDLNRAKLYRSSIDSKRVGQRRSREEITGKWKQLAVHGLDSRYLLLHVNISKIHHQPLVEVLSDVLLTLHKYREVKQCAQGHTARM